MRVKKLISTMIAAAVTVAMASVMTVSSTAPDRSRLYQIYDYNTQSVDENYILLHSDITSAPATASIIDGEDDRIEYANSGIVYLRFSGNIGTGFIIGDNTIATCAHNVYDKAHNGYYTAYSIELYNNSGNYVTTIAPTSAHIPYQYISSEEHSVEEHNYDYALLTVSTDLSDYEHFQLGVSLDNAGNIPVTVSGFPKTVNGVNVMRHLYTNTGTLFSYASSSDYYGYRLHYNTDTSGGQSGSPVYTTTNYQVGNNAPVQSKTVIGIHTSGPIPVENEHDVEHYESDAYNSGVKITSELLNFYYNNTAIN